MIAGTRTMTLAFVICLAGGSLALQVRAQEEAPFFPLQVGRSWTYSVEGTDERVTARLGERTRIVLWHLTDGGESAVEAWPLAGFPGTETYVVEREGGVVLAAERSIGFAGEPAIVPVAEFRWEGDSWKFESAEGCLVGPVECKRVGVERITVPRGEFECLRIEVGTDQTFWLARGEGIVRWSDRRYGTEVARVLESTSDGK
ncbi:MAG: hypothetical protein HY720_27540 [Planctomycetes bacterium]|nr:hypothetical protein [Planctomycetota bacterium]